MEDERGIERHSYFEYETLQKVEDEVIEGMVSPIRNTSTMEGVAVAVSVAEDKGGSLRCR